MTTSKAFDIVDAIVGEINRVASEVGFSQPLTASREVMPSLAMNQIKGVVVSVVPRSVELSQASRSSRLKRYKVDVAVMRRAQPQDDLNALVETMVDLTNEIREALSGQEMSGAVFIGDAIDPIYSLEFLMQQRTFLSVLRLDYGAL